MIDIELIQRLREEAASPRYQAGDGFDWCEVNATLLVEAADALDAARHRLEALRTPVDARARFALATAKIERDVRLSELTDAEIDSLVEALRTQGDGERWQSMDSAPLDGTQFLALLSNGWYDLLASPGKIDEDDRYRWWMGRHGPPIESTHRQADWGNTIRAVAWMPLPASPTRPASQT